MALPRLNENSQYELTIPSKKEVVQYRPFLVKEQKVLLIAYESQDRRQILNAMLNTIESCLKEPLNVKTLSTFDVDYMFTQIRAKSVGETSEILIACTECETQNEIKINLEEIKIDVGETNNLIELTDKISVRMRFPNYDHFISSDVLMGDSTQSEQLMALVVSCLDAVETEDERISMQDESEEEIMGFLDSLTSDQFDKIAQFTLDLPKLEHEVSFKCKNCGADNKRILRGIDDFF